MIVVIVVFMSLKLILLQKMDRDISRHHSARHRPPDECIVGNYRFIKTIGRGNFAKVKLAKHLPTGRQVKSIIALIMSV
jgi:serine/threonine protein kinase